MVSFFLFFRLKHCGHFCVKSCYEVASLQGATTSLLGRSTLSSSELPTEMWVSSSHSSSSSWMLVSASCCFSPLLLLSITAPPTPINAPLHHHPRQVEQVRQECQQQNNQMVLLRFPGCCARCAWQHRWFLLARRAGRTRQAADDLEKEQGNAKPEANRRHPVGCVTSGVFGVGERAPGGERTPTPASGPVRFSLSLCETHCPANATVKQTSLFACTPVPRCHWVWAVQH